MARPTDDPIERYTRWHWGIQPGQQVEVDDPDLPDRLVECGKLVELHYTDQDGRKLEMIPNEGRPSLVFDMDHDDHVALIREGIPKSSGIWADFGSGSGAFTHALAEILEPGSQIYSVDKNAASLQNQARTMRTRYPGTEVQYLKADYTQSLDLPPLDGAIMANSLHFQRTKDSVLALIRGYLQPWGRLILVEYNLDQGNTWVPYPLSYKTWERMARKNGFASTRLLARRPSRFMGEIYSALSCLNLERRDAHERGR